MIRGIWMILLALFCVPAFPSDAWHTSTVQRVYPLADGRIVLMFHTDSADCTNSNDPKFYYLAVAENGVTEKGLD